MTKENPTEDAEITTAEELERISQERREKNLDQIDFDQCKQVREAGEAFRNTKLKTPQEAVKNVSNMLEINKEQAKELLSIYTLIFTQVGGEASGRSSVVGMQYFSGHSIEDLADEHGRTENEIQGDVRAYIGSRLREAEIVEISLNQTLPESPPNPMIEAIENMDFGLNATGITIADLRSKIRERFSLAFQNLLEPIQELGEQYREIDESDFEFKWLKTVTHKEFVGLYNVYKEEGNQAAAERLAAQLRDKEDIAHFKRYLEKFDTYNQRRSIIDEAMDAHLEGRYALSIPALLSQLDGVFIDVVLELGLYIENDAPTSVEIVGTGEGSPQYISEISEEFRKYYASELWGIRVGVLHGRDTDFSEDEILSAKLLWLLFQTLHTVERIRSADQIGDYHIAQAIQQNSECSRSMLTEELPYQSRYVSERLQVLVEKDVVVKNNRDRYTITAKGARYLEGDVDLGYGAP